MPNPKIYVMCDRPYSPSNPETLNFGFGNLVAERVESGGNQAGDFYFKERGSNKVLCWAGRWTRRDAPDHSGCFCFLNGALATFNPEEPGASFNGVAEFRLSRIGNA